MAESPRIQELRRRVQSDPASIAFAALAEEYRRAGRFDEAVAACLTGLHRHPSYLSARVTLGRSLLEIGRYDEAQEELEHVLELAPENLAAIRGLAEIQHRRADGEYGSRGAASQAAPEPAVHAPDRRLNGDPAGAPVFDLRVTEEASEPTASDLRLQPEPAEVQGLVPAEGRAAEAPASRAPEARHDVMAESTLVDDAPALAGLEEFLAAIIRARAERSTTR